MQCAFRQRQLDSPVRRTVQEAGQGAIVHIPYRGRTPAMTDLRRGQVHLVLDNLPSALPHIGSGRVRAIGVTSGTHSSVAPDIPARG